MKKSYRMIMIVIMCLLISCAKTTPDSPAYTSAAFTEIKLGEKLRNQLSPNHTTEIAGKEKTDNAKKNIYTQIEWLDLIPKDDLLALENPPAYLGNIEDGSADDRLPSQLKTTSSPSDDRYQQALNSTQILPEFNGRNIRIPGFIVPLTFNDKQTISTFFLVPFFGACLHMPPPPPNQIIYAEYEPGIRLDSLFDPFWIEGTLSTTLVENDMATASYSIHVVLIEPYVEG